MINRQIRKPNTKNLNGGKFSVPGAGVCVGGANIKQKKSVINISKRNKHTKKCKHKENHLNSEIKILRKNGQRQKIVNTIN